MGAATRSDGSSGAFWPAVVLGAVCAAAKATYVDRPETRDLEDLVEYARKLCAVSYRDALFAAGAGLVAAVLLLLLARLPRARKVAAVALATVGAACAAYAVLSLRVFEYFHSPLTYALARMAGDLHKLRSSIEAQISAGFVAGLVAAPVVFVLLSWALVRLDARLRTGARIAARAVVLALAAGLVAVGWQHDIANWSKRPDKRLAESPHWVFLSSCVAEAMGGGGAVILADDFPRENLAEFAPREGRPPARSTLETPRGRPKNVILVVLESVAAHWLSVYGCRWDTTPRLAEEVTRCAVVYESGYAHVGKTTNSLIALSLSQYPGLTWRDLTEDYPRMPGRSIADALHARGYRTAFVTSGDLTWASIGDFLADRGFDEVRGFPEVGEGKAMSSWGGQDRYAIDATLEAVDRARAAPFFIMTWTDQTHHPYEPSPDVPEIDFFGKEHPEDEYDLGRYLNVLHETDAHLGRLFEGLRARGIADDTLVVITGDHGEGFGEPHPTWGHGFAVWQESVQVPMILWSPRLFASGRRDPTVCAHVDIGPTILDALGIEAPGEWLGRSFFEAGRPGRAYFYAATEDYLLAVREGRWKYVFNATRGREELYDLDADPLEARSVAAGNAELRKRLHGTVAAWAHSVRENFQKMPASARGR